MLDPTFRHEVIQLRQQCTNKGQNQPQKPSLCHKTCIQPNHTFIVTLYHAVYTQEYFPRLQGHQGIALQLTFTSTIPWVQMGQSAVRTGGWPQLSPCQYLYNHLWWQMDRTSRRAWICCWMVQVYEDSWDPQELGLSMGHHSGGDHTYLWESHIQTQGIWPVHHLLIHHPWTSAAQVDHQIWPSSPELCHTMARPLTHWLQCFLWHSCSPHPKSNCYCYNLLSLEYYYSSWLPHSPIISHLSYHNGQTVIISDQYAYQFPFRPHFLLI